MFLKKHSYDSTFSELCQTQNGWNPCLLMFYSKAGISDIFEGHYGPATGIDTHSAAGPIDFSYLFLTSSFDWTIKLWSHKVRSLNRNFRTTLLHLPFYFPKSLNARQESRILILVPGKMTLYKRKKALLTLQNKKDNWHGFESILVVALLHEILSRSSPSPWNVCVLLPTASEAGWLVSLCDFV